MRAKYWFFTISVIVTFIAASSLLVASARFIYEHPRAPGVQFIVDANGAARLNVPHAAPREPDPSQTAMLSLNESHFDFGDMNPHSVGEHVFELRNVGTGTLVIKNGGSSCKCAAAEIHTRSIPPGKTGEVLVSWHTGSQDDSHYAEHVVLATNDPLHSEVRLSITGRVARVCTVTPEAALFPSLGPNNAGRAELLVFSRCWEDFEITSVRNPLEQLSWECRPATAEQLAEHQARSGQWLSLTISPAIPAGEFAAQLMVTARPAGPASNPVELPLPVSGTKLGRISIIGAEIDTSGTVCLGTVTQGHEKLCRLLVRYRGDSRTDVPLRVQSNVAYLQATLDRRPHARDGLFELAIRVLPDAPLCNHLHPHPVQLRLTTDHPRDPQITLQVEFAVMRP